MYNIDDIKRLQSELSGIDTMTFDDIVYKIEEGATEYMSYNWSYGCKEPYYELLNISVADSIGEWMVFRTIQIRYRQTGVMTFPSLRFGEVAQEWRNKSGDIVRFEKRYWKKKRGIYNLKSEFKEVKELPNYFDAYNWGYDAPSIFIQNIKEDMFCVLKDYYGEGYNVDYGQNTCNSIYEFATSEIGEFLFKCGYRDLFYQLVGGNLVNCIDDVIKYFPSIKIAHRHHYDFAKDITLWLDLMRYIDKCNADIRQPKFICPDDLRAMHDRFYKYYNKNYKKIAEQERIKKLLEDSEFYRDTHKMYFGIVFGSTEHNLQFSVIQSAEEMIEEGKSMHHCVGGYVKKDNSLIISCKYPDGTRLATIEVDLSTFKIVQTRGLQNCVPEHFDEINNTIEMNMDYIRNAKHGKLAA